jgi:drug/metabolite transporter (DMT)-like permease
LDSKTTGILLGALLIIIALILAVVQHFTSNNLYGDPSNKWYFWGLVIVIGLIGLILAAWMYMKKPAPTPAQ